MKKLTLAVLATMALLPSEALADGPYGRVGPAVAAPPPAYEAPPTWSGFYIGAGGGASSVAHDVSITDDLGTILRFDQGDTGAFGSVIVGWIGRSEPRLCSGIFADYDFSNVSTDLNAIDGLLTASLEHSDSWAIGARLGWLSSPATLWYLTGGYTQAQFDARVVFDGATLLSHDRTFNGYFLGGGIDNRLGASNWFLRLEYRYAQFDSESRP